MVFLIIYSSKMTLIATKIELVLYFATQDPLLSNIAYRQTHKTNASENIDSFAKKVINMWMSTWSKVSLITA